MLWSTGGILIKLIPWNAFVISEARSVPAAVTGWCVWHDYFLAAHRV